jgi:NADH-quinone oxidoreductase subunit J
MPLSADFSHWALGSILILSSLGVILVRNPVHASLSFLLTLFALAALYLQLSAQFIAVMQILVYAGAILVLFVFVIVLFQDAHQQIALFPAKSSPWLLWAAAAIFSFAFIFFARHFLQLPPAASHLPDGYGSAHDLGWAIYLDFFFPFEAIVLLFLVAVIGALYIAKKER